MIVIYFNALILLIGFELNVSIHELTEEQSRGKFRKFENSLSFFHDQANR
jgi:uncharacterized BrkB/YihY/UPF0761 family membrane protein